MRRRLRGLGAIVIASAAIGGAFAAPASANKPVYNYSYECLTDTGAFIFGDSGTSTNARGIIKKAKNECINFSGGNFGYFIEQV
jgi:hypothetical protein